MANLAKSDIVDTLVKCITDVDDSYLDRADSALVDFALSFGVASTDIETTNLPFRVKEWLKAYVGKEVCFNNAGLSERLIEKEGVFIDVYGNKLEMYLNRFNQLNKMITKEILTGDADTPEEYASSFSTIHRA